MGEKKYYVYQFIDPRNDSVFYVGKGTGNRINKCRYEKDNTYLYRKIDSIRKTGLREQRKIIKHFDNECEALDYEAEVVTQIGLQNLCNITPGGQLLLTRSGSNHPSWQGDHLVNKRFGSLVVIRRTQKKALSGNYYWLCRCDCGIEKKVIDGDLMQAKVKSCGCLRARKGETHHNWKGDYLMNQKFGKMLVLSRSVKKNGEYTWLCRCDCGKERSVRGPDLASGNTKSCGCGKNLSGYKHPNWKGDYLVGKKIGRLTVLKRGKKCRGRHYWLCECNCGNFKEIMSANLVKKNSTKSCGCLRKNP